MSQRLQAERNQRLFDSKVAKIDNQNVTSPNPRVRHYGAGAHAAIGRDAGKTSIGIPRLNRERRIKDREEDSSGSGTNSALLSRSGSGSDRRGSGGAGSGPPSGLSREPGTGGATGGMRSKVPTNPKHPPPWSPYVRGGVTYGNGGGTGRPPFPVIGPRGGGGGRKKRGGGGGVGGSISGDKGRPADDRSAKSVNTILPPNTVTSLTASVFESQMFANEAPNDATNDAPSASLSLPPKPRPKKYPTYNLEISETSSNTIASLYAKVQGTTDLSILPSSLIPDSKLHGSTTALISNKTEDIITEIVEKEKEASKYLPNLNADTKAEVEVKINLDVMKLTRDDITIKTEAGNVLTSNNKDKDGLGLASATDCPSPNHNQKVAEIPPDLNKILIKGKKDIVAPRLHSLRKPTNALSPSDVEEISLPPAPATPTIDTIPGSGRAAEFSEKFQDDEEDSIEATASPAFLVEEITQDPEFNPHLDLPPESGGEDNSVASAGRSNPNLEQNDSLPLPPDTPDLSASPSSTLHSRTVPGTPVNDLGCLVSAPALLVRESNQKRRNHPAQPILILNTATLPPLQYSTTTTVNIPAPSSNNRDNNGSGGGQESGPRTPTTLMPTPTQIKEPNDNASPESAGRGPSHLLPGSRSHLFPKEDEVMKKASKVESAPSTVPLSTEMDLLASVHKKSSPRRQRPQTNPELSSPHVLKGKFKLGQMENVTEMELLHAANRVRTENKTKKNSPLLLPEKEQLLGATSSHVTARTPRGSHVIHALSIKRLRRPKTNENKSETSFDKF